jgi:hypothetical protein
VTPESTFYFGCDGTAPISVIERLTFCPCFDTLLDYVKGSVLVTFTSSMVFVSTFELIRARFAAI